MTEKPSAPDINERTFSFAVRIVRLCQHLDARPGVSRTLNRQVLRSGTSIGANLEEAEAAQSRADFLSKHQIALKEARETVYWLRLLAACGILPGKQLAALQDEATQLAKIIVAIVISTKRKGRADAVET